MNEGFPLAEATVAGSRTSSIIYYREFVTFIFKAAEHIYCGPRGDVKIIILFFDLLKIQKHKINKRCVSPRENMKLLFYRQMFL